VPYLRGIMDALSDSTITRVVVPKAAQIGATEAIVNNVLGFYIHQDPAPPFDFRCTRTLRHESSRGVCGHP
jgi:phage terminase large subunit GpA-like protein